MLEAAEADLALEAGFVHVKARQAFPEIGRQVRRREQTAFRASRWRRRSCRALPDAPAPPKLRDRVRGWDLEMLWGRRRGDGIIVAVANRWSAPMPQPNDPGLRRGRL